MIATRDEIPAKPWIDDEAEMYSGWMKMLGEGLEDLVAQSKSTGPLGNILALLGGSYLDSRARLLVECFDALHAAGVAFADDPASPDAILEVAAHARKPMGGAELAPSAESEDEPHPHPELFAPVPPAPLAEDELARFAQDAFAELAALRQSDAAPHSPSDEVPPEGDLEISQGEVARLTADAGRHAADLAAAETAIARLKAERDVARAAAPRAARRRATLELDEARLVASAPKPGSTPEAAGRADLDESDAQRPPRRRPSRRRPPRAPRASRAAGRGAPRGRARPAPSPKPADEASPAPSPKPPSTDESALEQRDAPAPSPKPPSTDASARVASAGGRLDGRVGAGAGVAAELRGPGAAGRGVRARRAPASPAPSPKPADEASPAPSPKPADEASPEESPAASTDVEAEARARRGGGGAGARDALEAAERECVAEARRQAAAREAEAAPLRDALTAATREREEADAACRSAKAADTSDEEKVRTYWVAIEKWAAEDLARRRVVEHRFDLKESGGGTDDGCFARRRGDEWQFFADARGIFEAFRGAVPNFFGCVLTTSYQIGPVLQGKNVIPGFEARLWPTDVPQELVEKAVAAMARETISKKRAAEDLARRRVVEHRYDLKESGGTAADGCFARRVGEEWQFFANARGICEAFREAFPNVFGTAKKTGAQVRSVLRGEKRVDRFEARLWPTDVPPELVEKAVAAMAKKSKKTKASKEPKETETSRGLSKWNDEVGVLREEFPAAELPTDAVEVAPVDATGSWTPEEHRDFLRGFYHGLGASGMAKFHPTRTADQIRTHAQKYFAKMASAEPGEAVAELRAALEVQSMPGSADAKERCLRELEERDDEAAAKARSKQEAAAAKESKRKRQKPKRKRQKPKKRLTRHEFTEKMERKTAEHVESLRLHEEAYGKAGLPPPKPGLTKAANSVADSVAAALPLLNEHLRLQNVGADASDSEEDGADASDAGETSGFEDDGDAHMDDVDDDVSVEDAEASSDAPTDDEGEGSTTGATDDEGEGSTTGDADATCCGAACSEMDVPGGFAAPCKCAAPPPSAGEGDLVAALVSHYEPFGDPDVLSDGSKPRSLAGLKFHPTGTFASLGGACVQIKSSTRLQCARIRMF
ncbi:hypothetical protein SO694_001050100 [Aureococcus anophagefferens]|uniref:Myb-like domain-containing protein n=1 Tax=Aureococcus anophagefferens TaxID=44056 RepID=A0ABR1FMB3_AURAN